MINTKLGIKIYNEKNRIVKLQFVTILLNIFELLKKKRWKSFLE